MKKIIAVLILATMLLPILALQASAAVDATKFEKPIDVTSEMKYHTVIEMYKDKLPVVRADAKLVLANEYDASVIGVAPGAKGRAVTITDWESAGLTNYFDDYFNFGGGYFSYDSIVWANTTKNETGDGDDRGQMVYSFEVDKAGTYEFVFVGAAEIKPENVDNDAKDRGFSFSVDNGAIRQVNITDTKGCFGNGYVYNYSTTESVEKEIKTTNGVNAGFYEVAYYYNLTAELTAGKHTLEYYHLFYSGDTTHTDGASRLNFAGFYVQEFLEEALWSTYQYPETTVPETTTPVTTAKPVETTKKAEVTTAKPAAQTTAATPDATTKAPEVKKEGCGKSAVLYAFVQITLVGFAAIVFIKKK